MKLFNTLSRSSEDFKTLQNKTVRMYACGLTVYSHPHIGNWVAYIYWDILVRCLRASGYDVIHVQNITDVGHLTSDEDAGEDKMLKGALAEGKTAWEVAEKYIAIADNEAYNQLQLLRPTHMPRATEYIPQQIAFVQELEKKGFTYTLEDGVYFDTSKLNDYGKLAKLNIQGLRFGARVEVTGKKNPTDFALWKLSPPDQKRDMEWDSPWGTGFPGWHLECSVMIRELLGDSIDVHTGGIDHIPVHHTNEIAQSETVTGKQLSTFWLHANHIKVNGTKMSKSLGNIYTLEDLKNKGFDLNAFKLMVLSKHYRTEGNFTWDILEAAQSRLRDIYAVADMCHQTINEDTGSLVKSDFESYQTLIINALSNDLNTPEALKYFYDLVNFILLHPVGKDQKNYFKQFLIFIDEVFGLSLINRKDISTDLKKLISERQIARDHQNWQRSDELRKLLESNGLLIRDTNNGQFWTRV